MQQVENSLQSVINPKAVAKYVLLPGLFPRLLRLAGHFSKFLFIFIQLFGAVGLIDRNHPCLRAENIGRYRFTDIIGLAASNVVFDKKHIPQIVMFFAVVLSIVLTLCIGMAALSSALMYAGEAKAQFFGAPKDLGYAKDHDWAFRFLFRIFGDTSAFGGPQAGESVGNPWFTAILTGMLKHYSMAMLVVAAFMILYIMVMTLTEAAQTGKPFGSRFDSIWAPIRLALAIGLLIPISGPGYNGAQLLVFQSAVWGSNLATNVWYAGVNTLKCEPDTAKPLKPGQVPDPATKAKKCPNLFATAMSDPGYRFLRDIFLVNLCIKAFEDTRERNNNIGIVYARGVVNNDQITYSFGPDGTPDLCGKVTMLAIPGKDDDAKPAGIKGPSWAFKTITAYRDIAITFLPITAADHAHVEYWSPYKKAAAVAGTVLIGPGVIDGTVNVQAKVHQPMSDVVDGVSRHMMKKDNPKDTFSEVVANSTKMAPDSAQAGSAEIMNWITAYRAKLGSNPLPNDAGFDPFFSSDDYVKVLDAYSAWLFQSLTKDAQYGWTTAGVFYMRISSAMSAISKVVNNPPRVTQLPTNFSKPFATADNPSANSDVVRDKCSGFLMGVKRFFSHDALCDKYDFSLIVNDFLRGGQNWFEGAVIADVKNHQKLGGDSFERTLDIAEPEPSANLNAGFVFRPILDYVQDLARMPKGDLHPLGAVISWGNALMNMAGIAYLVGLAGMGTGLTTLAFTIGHTLILPGFILAFYVPMIPFLHFTFAVVEWMISILEAVIGMPLFALSMITLEGDGLSKGMDGVKRLFEIVLRPTVIIMSLMASVIIFTACVSFFNDAMSLYAQSYASGSQQNFFQAGLAGFGMIFIYMFGIYSIATSCFKLIDDIPDKFGRWMGLEGGFGSQIKTGVMSGLSQALVAGAAFGAFSKIGGAGKEVRSGIQKTRREKKKKSKQI